MLIQILDELWLDIWAVTAIKKIDEKSCALWLTGQSGEEGLVLDYPAEEVAQAINDEREKDGDDQKAQGETGRG